MTRMQLVRDRDLESALSLKVAAVLALAGMIAAFLFLAEPGGSAYALRSPAASIELVEIDRPLVEPPRPQPRIRPVRAVIPIADPHGKETDSSLVSYIHGLDTAVVVTDIEPPMAYYKVERPPVLLSMPGPEYPEMCRAAGVEGRVVVHLVVGLAGGVDSAAVYVSSGNSALDRAAVAAVRGAQFRPGMQRDRAVRVLMAVPVRFALN